MSADLDLVGTPELVADQFDRLVTFSQRFDRDRQVIAASEFPLSQATVTRLRSLLDLAQPAAEVRALLGRLEPGRLMAGVAVWATRQAPRTATDRAKTVWATGQLQFEADQ